MDAYAITKNDIYNNFFHFTQLKNFSSIRSKGLIPTIGNNAKYLEKNPKVFFVNGLDNLLILFDCWINVYEKLPLIPFFYTIGSRLIRFKWFPKFISDTYFKFVSKYKHRKRAFKVFDYLIQNSILLQLDLKENIDFKWDDNDEIKLRGYHKDHLITMGYSLDYSDINTTIMDKWNMHTLKNRGVNKKKLKLCYINNSYKLVDIFFYALNNTKLDLEKTCPTLYEYINNKEIY